MEKDGSIEYRQGFIFAFFKYQGIKYNMSVIQYLAHYLLASDIIHVAMIPVYQTVVSWVGDTSTTTTATQNTSECKNNDKNHNWKVKKTHAFPTAFTAFWGIGVDEPETMSILNKNYDFYFMPVDDMVKFQSGLDFLISLRGAKYNYFDLPLTLMPTKYKHFSHHHAQDHGMLSHFQYHTNMNTNADNICYKNPIIASNDIKNCIAISTSMKKILEGGIDESMQQQQQQLPPQLCKKK